MKQRKRFFVIEFTFRTLFALCSDHGRCWQRSFCFSALDFLAAQLPDLTRRVRIKAPLSRSVRDCRYHPYPECRGDGTHF